MLLRFDGASKGNPGKAAAGVVVFDDSGTIFLRDGLYLGVATNNVAEYRGLLLGLDICLREGWTNDLRIEGDSLLVINQVSGKWKVKDPTLQWLHREVESRLRLFSSRPTFTHILRNLNSDADRCANLAME